MTQVRQMGGFVNASTSPDRTNYFAVAPKDSLNALLRIEALRMIDPLEGVTAADLKVEREVVRNELRISYENGTFGSLGPR